MAVCPRNGTLIIQGEINKLLIAMKRGTTWSSYSQQDEKIEALLKKFNNLKVELNSIGDLKSIDSILFLEPFLEVITSDQTSSSVTSLALVSINTFLSYALIDPGGHNVAASVCKIAEAVTRAKFSSSDLDSVVLMRILLVLRNLVVSPIGVYLTNENVCEIMSSIFRVCFETRLAELLRKYAEHCLKDIVQCLFTQLPQFSEDLDDPSNVKSISTRSESSHNKQQRQKKISQESVTSDVDTVVHNNASPDDKVQTELPPNDNIHLATSPCSPSGPMLDLQGDILSQDTLQSPSGDMLQSPNGETPGDILNGDIQRSCENFPEEIKHTQSAEVIQDPVTQEVQTQDIQSETVDPRDSTSLDISADKQDVGEADVQTHPDETNAQQNGEPVNQEGQSNDVQQIRESDQPEEYVNQQGVRFTSSDPVEEGVSKGPYGIVSVREILRCLVQLCDSHNKNNSESMIHIGLTLLSVAFEVGADSIAQFPSLMAIVKDDMCKYLIALLFTADRLTIFAANLQLLFLVFESMRHHLKFQFEMYLTRLLDIISSDNQRFRYEMKEIALESIVQLWRIPGLVTELYLNYDCNLYCPNHLFN
ncbi:Golgi-specific brefeldin A-resistance guanine nucleotide exchange factor 1 [Diaphorina citri]|uniref:Golgi-specific brefeldin A-resistance guanine nucleotide exchange factor 1 n=1 Tax=Diaphorina citri TaxID=121845 RepID=A0A3Q0J0I0_DIACI|nr:Golgi-specific brefeldin A-resistance guanine nucleotide exchange factor 1 [Diaphorina citri]